MKITKYEKSEKELEWQGDYIEGLFDGHFIKGSITKGSGPDGIGPCSRVRTLYIGETEERDSKTIFSHNPNGAAFDNTEGNLVERVIDELESIRPGRLKSMGWI